MQEARHEARLYQRVEDNTVRCSLCPHRCTIREGKQGICGVRINRNGTLYAATYAKISSEAVDPIEKKPLYHFLPGTLSYSIGSIGCNFHCSHCQNWHISQPTLEQIRLRDLSPEEGVRRALAAGCRSISWTYNEPTIWHEYALDMGTLAKRESPGTTEPGDVDLNRGPPAGSEALGTVYVTNGYITEEGLREASAMLDAFRVDIKAFSDEFYKKVCGARLQPVLDATVVAKELGMHVETVTLVIPGLNDSIEEMDALIRWVLEHLGPDIPMHFTRFHPDYEMRDRGATRVEALEKIYEHARKLGVRFPYLGNVFGHRYESTYCPVCGTLLIERTGFGSRFRALDDHACTSCGEYIPYVSHITRR
ncbi:MAG: radical SAM protein [Methanomicrobiaceae archaeon]|uniref:Radical sam, pyruvate-formate lyase-activating enzyme like n=1 Tax=hydrocarbon metagenome TaxID=938273 RepID=A0A0W8FH34_9ZZZZ|nr:radical SAM protein [Methanomicrobiaceae archaeon]MDD5418913.1 radical SAM protein [Methanomicrobiaceae archaeon]